ncbi:MAG: class I SAM-dependent methyltransferase [Solirubrobacteraceae bacterium]
MSVATATAAFSAHAREYDGLRRRLVPDFDGFYGALIEVLGLLESPPRRVLDLGAGTGLVSTAVLAAHPTARIELLDASEPMLDQALERLGDAVAAVHVADMTGVGGIRFAGPFDAVVSALAIHHLSDADKRGLFARVHEILAPGGVFVNAEQVAAPDPDLVGVYTDRWIGDCRALGATEAEIDGARERMRYDRCADVGSQLRWLREAGLARVDCVYKHWRFAVICGFKEAR